MPDYDEDDYDDWYDDDPGWEPEPPGCGLCYETLSVPARFFAARGRMRRCPSCFPNVLVRLIRTLRPSSLAWHYRRWRNRAQALDEAPF